MPRLLSLVVLAISMAASAHAQSTGQTAERITAEPQFIAALADLYTGDPARAITRLNDVLAVFPEDPVVLDALAEAYHAQGLTAEALYHAEQAASLAPDDAAIQRRLAEVYDASGDAVRAQQAREIAQRIEPSSAAPPAPQPPPTPARPAESTDPDLPGEAAYRAGRFAEAADALLAEVDDNPRNLRAWALALDALARTTDPRAGDTADLALLLFPTVPAILVPAAEALHAIGRSADASAAATSAIRLLGSGTDDPALRQRADALLSSLR